MRNLTLGDTAPDFEADSTFGKIRLSNFRGNWVVLMSYCGDFTPVCTSEIIELSKNSIEFYNKKTQVICLSRDSHETHLAWLYAIKMSTGIDVQFPVISDKEGYIYEKYNMKSYAPCTRNVFLINPNGKISAIMIYPEMNGRNIEEILRLLTAQQVSIEKMVLTPANWQQNQAAMLPPPTSYQELIAREDECHSCSDWYLCYN